MIKNLSISNRLFDLTCEQDHKLVAIYFITTIKIKRTSYVYTVQSISQPVGKIFIEIRVQPECGVRKCQKDVQNNNIEGRDSSTGTLCGQQTNP